jgi:hypothetical protein
LAGNRAADAIQKTDWIGEAIVSLHSWKFRLAAGVAVALIACGQQVPGALAQTATASADTAATEVQAPAPLTPEEMEILVARIALYPDDLVAVIVSSSLYPLQIVQAARFLDDMKTKPDLKPDPNWDGGVISLMNYPEIVKMMSEDLDWTQTLAEAITNQQQDVLDAIQQLRAKAVAEGIIKTDDKVKVVTEKETIVIQPASADVIYVPQYAPEMLYEPSYVPAPIAYYPQPYPYYYNPVAPFFAGVVTGVIWGSVVDWNDHGIWGGNGHWGNDVNIDCNHCFNNNDFSGKVNINDVDWKHVDRNKMSFDNNQFSKVDKTSFKNSVKTDNRNNITTKSNTLQKTRASTLPAGKGNQVTDVRKSTMDGLKGGKPGNTLQKPGQGGGTNLTKPGQGDGTGLNKPGQGGGTNLSKPAQSPGGGLDKKPNANFDRPVSKPKPASKPDVRPKSPSPIGEMNRGVDAKSQSNRGGDSMGGGLGGGGKPQREFKAPSAGGGGGKPQKKLPKPSRGGGGGGGGRR